MIPSRDVTVRLEWRPDNFGREDRALYLCNIWVGSIIGMLNDYMAVISTQMGSLEIGRFNNDYEARAAVEKEVLG